MPGYLLVCSSTAAFGDRPEAQLAVLDDIGADTLCRWDGHSRRVVSDDEDIAETGDKLGSLGVLHTDHGVGAHVLVDSLNRPDASAVAPSRNHHDLADVELVPFVDLPCFKVDLYGVVRLDVGVWEADRARVVCGEVRHTLVSEEDLLNSAQLEAGLAVLDRNKGEAALDVVKDAESLLHLGDLENVHEANGEGRVCAWLTVDQDVLVLKDHVGLGVGVGVVEAITQDEDERDALAKTMRAVCGPGGPDTAHLIKEPVLRCVKALKVLTGSAGHSSLSQNTVPI